VFRGLAASWQECGLTLPSRGRFPAYGLQAPLVSNVSRIELSEVSLATSTETVTMARDKGLEELIEDELRSIPNITSKAMFGGWAWLIGGNLFCGARDDGMLLRLGKGHDDWALQVSGTEPMISRGKRMQGWVRADARTYGDDRMRSKLLAAALEFARTLPRK